MKSLALIPLLAATLVAARAEPPMEHPRIAFIFDDGPTAENAHRLMGILQHAGIHATFGYVAANVEARPEIAREAVRAGHEIANHSYHHQHPKDLDDAGLRREIVEAQAIDTKASGVAPKWYWPPFIELDPRQIAFTREAGFQVFPIPHIIGTDDYKPEVSGPEIRRRASLDVPDGSVLLLHEWRNETLEQLPAIIEDLKKRGCVFLTFTELAAYNATRAAKK